MLRLQLFFLLFGHWFLLSSDARDSFTPRENLSPDEVAPVDLHVHEVEGQLEAERIAAALKIAREAAKRAALEFKALGVAVAVRERDVHSEERRARLVAERREKLHALFEITEGQRSFAELHLPASSLERLRESAIHDATFDILAERDV